MINSVLRKCLVAALFSSALLAFPGFANANCLSQINNMTGASTIPFTLMVSNPVGHPAPGWVGYATGTLRSANSVTAVTVPSVSELFSDRFNGSQPFSVFSPESIDFTITSSGVLTVTNHTDNFSWSATLACVAGASWIAAGNSSGQEVVLTFGARVN